MDGKIKVLVVDDSKVVRMFIAHLLNTDPCIQVIGMARNGREAIQFLSQGRPDVILMDIEMPEMDGLEATRRIMETQPIPVILCSGSIARRETFQLLASGAVAWMQTPHANNQREAGKSAAELLQTVKLMSEVKLVRRWPRGRCVEPATPEFSTMQALGKQFAIEFVGIGASTGGPPVLKTILEGLSADFPIPLLIVQHISRGFLNGLADWLHQATGVEVHIASHGESPLPGHAYLAPDDFHMEIANDRTISLIEEKPDHGVRPSVTHLFQSLANVCGPNAVGVLLTGMGTDGAAALKRMRERGATTIAQDRASSVIHGMPGEAIAIGAAGRVLSADQIAPALVALAHQHNPFEGVLS